MNRHHATFTASPAQKGSVRRLEGDTFAKVYKETMQGRMKSLSEGTPPPRPDRAPTVPSSDMEARAAGGGVGFGMHKFQGQARPVQPPAQPGMLGTRY